MRAPISPRHTCARARALVHTRVWVHVEEQRRDACVWQKDRERVACPRIDAHIRACATQLATLARRHTHDPLARTRATRVHLRGVRSFRGADITPPTQPFPSFSFSCFFLFSLCACYAGGKEEGKEGGWRKEISASFGISDSNIPLAPYQDYYMNVCGSLKRDLSRKIDSNSSYIVLLFASTITKRFVLNVFPSLDRSIDQFLRLLSFFSIHVLIYAIQFHLKNIPSSKWRGRFERSRVYRRDKGTKGRRNKGSRVKKWSTGRWNLSSRFKESLWNHDNRDSVLI